MFEPEDKGFLFNLLDSKGIVWLAILTLWGSTASYLHKINSSGELFRVVELFSCWVVSGFVGLMVAYLCEEAKLSFELRAFLIGTAGSMGGGLLQLLIGKLKRFIGEYK